jgi:AraC family transcriptional activator of tynA and feaB
MHSEHGKHWSTGDRPGQPAVAYWSEAVYEAMLEMEIKSQEIDAFSASLVQNHLGPLDLNFVTSNQHNVRRTRSMIARNGAAYTYLIHIRSGHFQLEQRDRASVTNAGDSVLFDTHAPYHFSSTHGTDLLAVVFPTAWLSRWLVSPEDYVAQNLPGDHGWGKVLSAMLSAVSPEDRLNFPVSDTTVAEQIATSLAITIGHQKAATDVGTLSRYRQQQLSRLRASLRERLHESDLDPAALATEHGLSRRAIHAVFAEAGSSFGREITALRMDTAKRLLDDPRFDQVDIAEVAWRCGYSDPSYFARCYRQIFGTAPMTWRKNRGKSQN